MFTYNLNSMNMFGMNSMGFGNMGMFGMGGFNMLGGLFGSSIFTNCDGSFNYDAAAGFGVGSVLMNIGGAAVNKVVQEKRANSKKALSSVVEDLNRRIADVKDERAEYTKDKEAREQKVKDANTQVTSLTEELNKLDVSGLETEYQRAKNEYTSAKSNDPNLETLKTAMENAEKAYTDAKNRETELKQQIADQQKIIDENTPEIETLEGKILSCDEELAELQAECDSIQGELNDKILNKADGNRLNRTSIEEFNAKDFSKSETTATKQDMRRAIAEYRTASPEKKEELKEKIKLIYDKLSAEDKSNDIRQAYSIIFG